MSTEQIKLAEERINQLRLTASERDARIRQLNNTGNSWSLHYAPPYSTTMSDSAFKILYMSFPSDEKLTKKKQVNTKPQDIFVFPLPPAILDGVTAEWDNESSFFKRIGNEGFWKSLTTGAKSRVRQVLGADKFDRDTTTFTHEDFMFKGVELRTFTFAHKLVPQSLQESIEMKEVVDRLQYNSLPTLKTSVTLTRPSEWEVHFIGPDGVEFLPKINRCIVESVNVNLTPNEHFQPSSNGYPNDIEIELTFKELAIRTAEHLHSNIGDFDGMNAHWNNIQTSRGTRERSTSNG